MVLLIRYWAVLVQYEDDEGDRVLLMTDSDLASAVLYAKSSGLKVFISLGVFHFLYA